MSKKRKGPTPPKRRLKLAVIPEPAPNTRSVLVLGEPGTIIMRGKDAPNLIFECGLCDSPLIVGMRTSQVQSLVFKCNGCGAFNETIE
jgi:hypothetical protein